MKNPFYNLKVKSFYDGSYSVFKYKNKRVKSNALTYVHNDNISISSKVETLEENRQKHVFEVKRKLHDYALNNEFDRFWTLTFDPKLTDSDDELRFDLMAKWLKTQRQKAKRKNLEFRYIFIPEYHPGTGENGHTVHWHGVTGGYHSTLVDSGVKHKGTKVYNCTDWPYGFTTVSKVRSKARVSNYIQKYLTKDFVNSPVRKGKKKYWNSKNLKLPKQKLVDSQIKFNREADWGSDIVDIFNFTADEAKTLHLDKLMDLEAKET